MFNKGKKATVKHRFEQPYDNYQSEWRKPQGLYHKDIDAFKRLNTWLTRFILYSRLLSLFLVGILFLGIFFMIFFVNFENVIFDDGSHLFCTVLKDGSVGIAY